MTFILFQKSFSQLVLGKQLFNIGKRNFTTSLVNLQYGEKAQKQSREEFEIITKSSSPIENVKESTIQLSGTTDESLKIQAANSFISTSIFYDEVVSKFVNCMMHGGKKTASERVMTDTFETIKKIQLEKYRKAENKEEVETDPLKIFHKAIENAKPVLGVQTMKKKGKNFQVPYPLPDNRRRFLAIKWFLTTARNRPGNSTPMSDKLSKELLDAYNNQGAVIQKKIDFHKRAELNRAFAHYRWW